MDYDETKLCSCGSGLTRYAFVDARGIFCAYVCRKCVAKKKAMYRPDIFTESDYWTDEPVDYDY